jgi:sugar lactone lactonase YvrE
MNQRQPQPHSSLVKLVRLSLVMVLFSVVLASGGGMRPALAADGGPVAKRVYGQPDFTSNAIAVDTLNSPNTVAVDSSGGIYVGDYADRVLYYPARSTIATRTYSFPNSVPHGVAVDDTGVYVAVNFGVLFFAGTETIMPTRRYTSHPDGSAIEQAAAVAVDSSGVYVVDSHGYAVLFYPGTSIAPTRKYGGKPVSCNFAEPRTVLCYPWGIAIAEDGIWVANANRHTTVFFPGSDTVGSGDLTTSWNNDNSYTGASFPRGVAVDRTGGVYIAEGINHRVLYYPSGSSVPTYAYGQPDLTSESCNTGNSSTPPTARTLCNPTDVDVDASGNVYITDGGNNRMLVFDPPPGIRGLRINDVDVVEGDTGTLNATFTVRLSSASTEAVTVDYVTANGSARAGVDYSARTGTLTFAPGTTRQTVTVPIRGDTLDELRETFFVNLTNPSNAITADAQGLGRITDNDLPEIRIYDVNMVEGNTRALNATFMVQLSSASTEAVTVDYATADGSAKAGLDYSTTTGTLTFAAGTTKRTIVVPVLGDTLDEPRESFVVNLTNPSSNVTPRDMQGLGSITDNDPPAIRIYDVDVVEGDTGTLNATFIVKLSSASTEAVTVDYATADGSAKAGLDYSTTTGTLTFAAGTTKRTIVVPVLGDTLDELREGLFVNLTNPINATHGDMQALGRIVDND